MNIDSGKSLIFPKIDKLPSFKPKLRLGVLASGKGSNFEAIVKSTLDKKLDANIQCLIVNKKNCGAIEKAKHYKIPFHYLDHSSFKYREDLDNEIIRLLQIYDVEGIVMAGWMRIVSSVLINKYPERIINIHPSLLPSFKGKDALTQALDHGVTITGCTVHIVKEEVDAGPILIQSAIPIHKKDNENSLLKKIQEEEHKILSTGIALAAIKWRNIAKDNK
ncbi:MULTISPECIES: phosphoribosylglycinamide formyltransferase [Prochlorococcus]|uniref:phosphoribosylglycinamide formyltransferase n=1 Tax=Prochlorococcus TaxID=1218 RepID=UPI0005338C50|nr:MULTISPECIES: phosphoribosylglycinamide formyltransferase [Prochlorococcus]KGG12471.1 Phosphoribosylglycinamide formyltransferase [Prochlorococcus sp. MIT 0601]